MDKIIGLVKGFAGDMLEDYLKGKFILLLIAALMVGFSLGFMVGRPSTKPAAVAAQPDAAAQAKWQKEFFRKAEGKY